MLTDWPLERLREYRPERVEPPNFAEFWRGTLDSARTAAAPARFRPYDAGLTTVEVYDLTFTGFAVRTAPVLAVVLVVEYVGLRLLFRERLAVAPTPDPASPLVVPRFPVAVVGAMLVGFAALSPFGGEPWWASLAAAVMLGLWAIKRGLARPIHLVHAAHPGFAIWVVALGVVVAGLDVVDLIRRLAAHGTQRVAGLAAVAVTAQRAHTAKGPVVRQA